MTQSLKILFFLLLMACFLPAGRAYAEDTKSSQIYRDIGRLADIIEPQVISWRRDIHEHPELSNREFRTSALVADHLKKIGLDEVRTGLAYTGVVGILRGGRPGPVVALRADMDALPIAEELDLPFASKVRTTYNGLDVGVMHACGHDGHTAILMGVAEVLANMRDQISGTVVFIFQPAEEGPPLDEGGGAKMMIAEGVLSDPRPEAIFGLHLTPIGVAGTISYRSGALMANESNFRIVVHGKQTHAGIPWGGVDPITIGSQLVMALQTIPSRQLDQSAGISVLSVGTFRGGTRHNIIPDEVEITGTFRTLNPEMVDEALSRIRRTSEMIARSAGGSASVEIDKALPVTFNDKKLTETMISTLERVVGPHNLAIADPALTAEDFAFYQQKIPGLFIYLGSRDPSVDPEAIEFNHSPRFFVDESALSIGVRAMANLAIDYLNQH